MKVGINGMGRIGRLALRAAMGAAQRPGNDPGKNNRLDVVHVNEIKGSAATLAHLLEFDSVQGRWRENIGATDNTIHIGEHDISVSNQSQSQDIAWDEHGVDLVLECTGKLLPPRPLKGICSAVPNG